MHWLIQTTADVDLNLGWLSPAEQERLATLTFPKRRNDWLLGRWTAKRLLCEFFAEHGNPVAPAMLTIAAAADGAPEVSGAPQPLSLSISHSGDHAFCALEATPGVRVGADLEQIAERHPSLVYDYFTVEEIALVQATPPDQHELITNAIWSAKEAVLKALRLGLTVDTRHVSCAVVHSGHAAGTWSEFAIHCDARLFSHSPAPRLRGRWRVLNGYVFALVTAQE